MGDRKRLVDVLTRIDTVELDEVVLAQQTGLHQVTYEAVALDSEVPPV